MNNTLTEEIPNIEMNIRRIKPDFSPDLLDLFYKYIKERLYQDNSNFLNELSNNKDFKDNIQKYTGNRINDITIEGGNIKVPENMIL